MATMRLVPASYTLSNTSYLAISDASNMYTNVDSTTYAQVTHNRNSTTAYYLYIHNFNFSSIPSNAVVTDFTIKIRALESGLSTSSTYRMSLYNNTTAISNTTVTSSLSTSATTFTFPEGSLTWDTLKGYGNNFRIRVPLRRNSQNTSGYVRIYGAEIEVTYTVPNPRSLSVTLSGDGTVAPSGTSTVYDGDEVEVTITPTNKSATVTATANGVDITSQLVAHGSESTTTLAPSSVTTSGIQSGSSYAQYAVGHTAESPSSSGASQNMYASSGSTGYAAYSFDFSSIPSNATIEDIEVKCYGHRESNTISSTYVSKCVLYENNTAISTEVDFPNTSENIITLAPTNMPTRSELNNVTVRHYVGYYGGLVRGISFNVTYSTGSGLDHYTYTFTVTSDMAIAVTIGGAARDIMYLKLNGAWTEASSVYKKVNEAWVQQTTLTSVFDPNINYKYSG